MNRYHIHYYAMLRETSGCSHETVESAALTPADLYDELATRHGFRFIRDSLRASVNNTLVPWSAALTTDDHISFLPPFAGG